MVKLGELGKSFSKMSSGSDDAGIGLFGGVEGVHVGASFSAVSRLAQ